MEGSGDFGVGDGFKVELPSEALEGVESCDGEVEIEGSELDFGSAVVFDLVIEMTEAIRQGIEGGGELGGIFDFCGPGFLFGKGLIGAGLLFEGVSGGADEDADDHSDDDEDQAAGEG